MPGALGERPGNGTRSHTLALFHQERFLEKWIKGCTGRQIEILCKNLGINGAETIRQKKDYLYLTGDQRLLPYLLVDQFAKFKSKVAVEDFAKRVIGEENLSACRINDQEFDKTALLFAVYHRNPADLQLIFHLDKIHKSGFARMRLTGQVHRPNQPFTEFLIPGMVTRILSDFDQAKGDRRISEFKNVVAHDGHHLLFIRRAERRDLILKAGEVVHGYRPEWIILDFAENAKRVNISSVSVSVPLEIANRLASAYFGKPCEYENENQITYSKQLERFLEILKDGRASELTLVEIVVANSPLEGSPKIKITDPESNPIGTAIGHFEKAVGRILANLDHIESIKVHYRKKRISLIFEKVDEAEGEYIVRYSDHRLNALERRSFESHFMETYGFPVLSTEKRFKHTR